jgi:hypothetical protein
MSRLFLAFANSPLAPLETLREEYERVHSLLALRERARHFRLLPDPQASIPSIAEHLQRYQDELALFHYGGELLQLGYRALCLGGLCGGQGAVGKGAGFV